MAASDPVESRPAKDRNRSAALRRIAAAGFLLAAGLISALRPAAASGLANGARPPGPHTMPRRIVPLRAVGTPDFTTPPHLSYYGGPVIGSVRMVMVLYGTGVDTQVVNGMPVFYQQIVNGPQIDWLCEYDTNRLDIFGRPGTQQIIRRGTWSAEIQITPDPSRDGATITDTDIQNELAAQFAVHALPAPDSSTLYVLHFPHGKSIELDPSDFSCVQYCGYHGSFYDVGAPVRYAVLPDMSPGSGCDTGCGWGSTFDVMTSVAWHELIESITDPDVALAATYNAPLAWYDAGAVTPGIDWGEIADICDDIGVDSITVLAGNGLAYVVQTLWSNAQNTCTDSGAGCGVTAVGDGGPAASLELETPNPARGRARFRVRLPGTSDVQLAVYDAAGRRVAELMRGVLDRGDYAAMWELGPGSGPPSPGVYFARLHAAGRTTTKTVVVLR